ncbi:MAG: LpxA family transferase, partial [Pseudomonadota bacterium]
MIRASDYIAGWLASPFDQIALAPWQVTTDARTIVERAFPILDKNYTLCDGIAIHQSATIEQGAIIKPPAIIGPNAFIATSAYLRGGVYLGEGCSIGPACEIKSSFLFTGASVAHLSFAGDSLIGAQVNIEAGAIIANHRNELDDKRIRIRYRDGIVETGVEKFGALIGDGVSIGANAVIAPGAILD